MKMTFRWYGPSDVIPLRYIRQIPNMSGVVTAVYDEPVGEIWGEEKIARLKALCDDECLGRNWFLTRPSVAPMLLINPIS